MKYWVRVGDRSYVVSILEVGGRMLAEIEGQTMELQLEEGAPGTYTLIIDERTYFMAAAPQAAGYSVAVQGIPFDVEVEDERQRRLSTASRKKEAAEGIVALRAPMPGLVTQVDAVEGVLVEKGSRLVVLEAMKMENDIRAPRAGRVEQVKVSQGETVQQGELLVVLG